jgi:hypothetical protein
LCCFETFSVTISCNTLENIFGFAKIIVVYGSIISRKRNSLAAAGSILSVNKLVTLVINGHRKIVVVVNVANYIVKKFIVGSCYNLSMVAMGSWM